MAASGLGAVVATLVIAFRGRPRPLVIPVAAIVLGILDVAVGLSRSMPIALVGMCVIGLASVVLTTYANTLIQTAVPDHLRGRVMALYVTVHGGSMPIGGVIFGAVAGALGADAALATGGACTVAVGLLAILARETFRSRDVHAVTAP